MPDSNDDFDLPRWQTHIDHAAQPAYIYPAQQQQQQQQPPPPPAQRIGAVHHTPSRQPRISQLVEQEHHLSPYPPTGQAQLGRSASLGASAAPSIVANRIHRRPQQSDDIEGAFPTDNQAMSGPRQQYFPTNAMYQPSSNPGPTSPPTDQYSDVYYNGSASHPKRLQPAHDPNPPPVPRGGRSPLRVPNTPISASPLDQYHNPSQYSPTASSYTYATQPEQRSHPATYQGHGRTHSMKKESMTPPISSSYSSQSSPYPSNLSATTYSSPYSMDASSPMPPLQSHLSSSNIALKPSASNPSTPLSYLHSNSNQSHYYAQDHPMAIDSPPKRRPTGFRRVRTAHDLQPKVDLTSTGRRMGADGSYLSPLRQLTTSIVDTYRICNPAFRYESTHNPRRVLTKPSKPVHNDGYDNEDFDYILYVNDWLGPEDGNKYLILDILGQGTFGQVVKCQNMKTHEIVAVKVVKNKPAYFNQSMMEVTILDLLNKSCDPNDEHHILRLRDSFIHRSHLCLVFELLSSNLYELIKQNQFQGLSTQLVKVFMAQLLDALTVLKEARLIHCDLKPENILLKSLQSPQIKVIDFGSACHERQTVYTYIQSRFYRSPEVLLGMSYTAAIDMWSLGCIAVELFLGLPLFPGTSEYNQLVRIVDMLGIPPLSMLNTGKQVSQFFDVLEAWNPTTNSSEKKYRIKSIEQYSREHNTNEQPGKQYFKATSLPEIINTAPMPSKTSRQPNELEKELNNRAAFIDFCQGLLNLNPVTRWTPQQARLHPFITGEKFTKPFVPDGLPAQVPAPTAGLSDPKRPYGGLVPSQPKGQRAYQDAASYNHHLAQHQAYTAQAQSQAATTFNRNPYIAAQQSAQPQHSSSSYAPPDTNPAYQPQQTQPAPPPPPAAPQHSHSSYAPNPPTTNLRSLSHQNSTGQITSGGAGHYPGHSGNPPSTLPAGLPNSNLPSGLSSGNVPSGLAPNPYAHPNRARATTINQLDNIPPALARLQHMNQDVIGGRNALTPVLNRDDAMREWERRQAGKAAAAQPYPQLEYLQQQAEMAAATGMSNWSSHHRYPPPPSKLSHAYQPSTLMVEDDGSVSSASARQAAVMSNVRAAARDPGVAYGGANVIASPPQSYATGSGGSGGSGGSRYQAAYTPQTQHQPSSGFDNMDTRRSDGSGGGGNMYVPMQPDSYQSYPPSGGAGRGNVNVPPPPPAGQPSFYGSNVVPAGQMTSVPPPPPPQGPPQQQRNPFQIQEPVKDGRRGNGAVDSWAR